MESMEPTEGQSSDAPTPGGLSNEQQPMVDAASASLEEVRAHCDLALKKLRLGKRDEAMEITEAACREYPDMAIVHRCHAQVCFEVALAGIERQFGEWSYLQEARESATKAYDLAPNDVEMARCFANLVYGDSTSKEDLDVVIDICEAALSVENPEFHGIGTLDNCNVRLGVQDRIASIRQDLEELIKMCRVVAVSDWLDSLPMVDKEGERIRLIPQTGDSVKTEIAPLQAGEEPRTGVGGLHELSGDVAAARDQHQQRSVRGKQQELELKNRKYQVRNYLNSSKFGKTNDLLKVRVTDLRKHFKSFGVDNEKLANQVLNEALKCDEMEKKWSGWMCYCCSEIFVHAKSPRQHTFLQHIGNLLPEARPILPENLSKEWLELFAGDPLNPLSVDLPSETLDLEREMYINACDAWGCTRDSYEFTPSTKPLDINSGKSDDQASKSEQNLVFEEDSSSLLMDEAILQSLITFLHDVVKYPDRSTVGFYDPGLGLSAFSDGKKDKSRHVSSLIKSIRGKADEVRSILDRKCEHLHYSVALLKQAKHFDDIKSGRACYRTTLVSRIGELLALEDELMSENSRYEMEAISNILRDGNRAVLDCYGEEEIDDVLGIAIQIQKDQVVEEMSRIDSKIISSVARMMKLLDELATASLVDYEAILLSLVKSYTQSKLENLAEKHANDIAEANAQELIEQDHAQKSQAESSNKSKKNKGKNKGAKVSGSRRH